MRCDEVELNTRPRTAGHACTVCGCTDDAACEGGCYWVSLDPPLCSACEQLAEDLDLEEPPPPPPPGFFDAQRCPASPVPALHTPLWLDETSGYCTRCRAGFVI